MNILAIESSCDETAAAIVENGVRIVSSVVASSAAMHEKYGGIVPEIAAREQLRCMMPTIEEALRVFDSGSADHKTTERRLISQHIDAVAVTIGPGLIGSLLIGVETAKTIAFVTGKPLIPVNHVLAHMYANCIGSNGGDFERIKFPAISLVVSGGHTELYLMTSEKELRWLGGTLDDAAGEAFDKTARLLGFGHGGGVAIQEAAARIKTPARTQTLPRPMLDSMNELNFSFSGLKTAILREVNRMKTTTQFTADAIGQLSYEVQEAITDVLVKKTIIAAKKYDAQSILLSGGVSANLRLREKFHSTLQKADLSIPFHVPPIELCTDNAAYIGSYAFFRGTPVDWRNVTATPDLSVEV